MFVTLTTTPIGMTFFLAVSRAILFHRGAMGARNRESWLAGYEVPLIGINSWWCYFQKLAIRYRLNRVFGMLTYKCDKKNGIMGRVISVISITVPHSTDLCKREKLFLKIEIVQWKMLLILKSNYFCEGPTNIYGKVVLGDTAFPFFYNSLACNCYTSFLPSLTDR